ncbi:integrase catalytic domain-containing protein [Trichonephila clavipes]|nr:integrase catalytic domain-containing protein [Trichonephila clavipes]
MSNHVKVPDLPLPTFSGKFQEFEQFKLEFMNLIGNNPSLNEVQKLCYLKGSLKNEASLIQSDQGTLDSLMKALKVRYENTTALVDIHIAEILSIHKNSENPSQILSIIDKIKINDSVTLQNSVFNYIVTGGLTAADDKQQCFLLSAQEGLESLISKFWQLESFEEEPSNLNSQVKFCEEHFVNNHRRGESGQYIVQMAFLKEPSCFGESKQTAIRRLNSLW